MYTDVEVREIARLNDAFRLRLTDGYVILHKKIRFWSRMCEVLDGIRVVPGGADEPMRDTGDLEVDGHRIVWKIHYYDPLGRFRCSPLDADCIRVLTAMIGDGFCGTAKEFWDTLALDKRRLEDVWQQYSMSMRQRLQRQMTNFDKRAGV